MPKKGVKNKKRDNLITAALGLIILLIILNIINRLIEISVLKGIEGYSIAISIIGMLVLVILLLIFFFTLLKKSKFSYWYGLILSILLLIASIFRRSYDIFSILNIIFFVALIVILIKERKKFK